MKIGVIADDFTGANDTGVQFSKKGYRTALTIYGQNSNINTKDLDVLVVDTESRFDSKETAKDKVFNAVRSLVSHGKTYIYKKIDSTLRGNIGAEIEGVMEAAGIDLAIIVPSFPQNGRTVENGMLLINGIPVSETEVSKDPITPVTCSYIPNVLANQISKKIGLIDYNQVTKGSFEVLKTIKGLYSEGIEVIVVDARSDDEISIIVQAIVKLNTAIVMAGSAGLARHISVNLLPEPLRSKTELNSLGFNKGPIVIMAGSVSDVMRRQVKYAEVNGNFGIVDLNIDDMVNGQHDREENRILCEVNNYISLGKDVIIRSARETYQVDYARKVGEMIGLSNFQVSEIISNFYGGLTKMICEGVKPKCLLLSGGDVAIKAVKALNVDGIIIKDEILPGIPFGYFVFQSGFAMPVVTKAGSFGKEDAIIKVVEYIKSNIIIT